MNREQWYQERRKWRAAMSSIDRSTVNKGLSESEQRALWDVIWDGIYMAMPKDIYESMKDKNVSWHRHWPLTAPEYIRCNLKHLRNSYPHRGRSV